MKRIAGETVISYVAAWNAWNAHPGAVMESNRFEDACQSLAAHLDISCNKLRDEQSAELGSGKTTLQVTTEMFASTKASKPLQ